MADWPLVTSQPSNVVGTTHGRHSDSTDVEHYFTGGADFGKLCTKCGTEILLDINVKSYLNVLRSSQLTTR